MNNPWDEVNAALYQAEELIRALDKHAYRMARLLRGRLRHASCSDVEALKRELADYNIRTGKWKPK